MGLVDPRSFIEKWQQSGASERANKDSFLRDLCDVLGVPHPDPATGDPDRDRYVFERDAVLVHGGDKHTVGKIDLYKHGCFVLEAKQGSVAESRKIGTARRDTPAWNIAMQEAFGQALTYASTIEPPPPFLIVTDIGYCFDIYAAFDGTRNYRKFPDALTARIPLGGLTDSRHIETLRAIVTDPWSLDPSKRAVKVTREVAVHLANVARSLDDAGHDPVQVAQFLMRCLFTMFVEDIGLLNPVFTKALKDHWIENPDAFVGEAESLWQTMNEGGHILGVGKIWKFNGGLFADPVALPLTKQQLIVLGLAAQSNWSDVEPAIFGTLLERALNPKERHRLGAHYTPRAYVERLVRPTIEEPLRAEWDVVRTQVLQLVSAEDPDKNRKAVAEARKLVHAFYERLRKVRVLDPACGSGNFLYVALDLFKRIENEVIDMLESLGVDRSLLTFANMVTPQQFLGIEINPWAKEITELVLWIGWLQWQIRTRGYKSHPDEPILRDYQNIEQRDAVLNSDREEPMLDDEGNVVTRWDGETMKRHPVTGEEVPDETARVPVMRYVNPRKAEWPAAEFVVGNPPFIGNKRMRLVLGDAYVDALRSTYRDMPESADFVMYWWDHAASLVRSGKIRQFGLITTNSITQVFNRRVLVAHMEASDALGLVFAVPDHPWVDSHDGAAVRVSMTVGAQGNVDGTLAKVIEEHDSSDDAVAVTLLERRGKIHENLRVGADVTGATPLNANVGLCGQGVKLVGDGFYVADIERTSVINPGTGLPVIRQIVNPTNVLTHTAGRYVIDFASLTEAQARVIDPAAYQQILTRVKPIRDTNKRKSIRELWWRFAWERPVLRAALKGLQRYFVTLETAKHQFFVALPPDVLWDGSLFAIALDDWSAFGVLSSRAHAVWSLATGGRLGVGNDPRYNNSRCFDPFPFPVLPPALRERIRELGEQLDAHRKRQQALHPDLTITGMYNVLEKLRSGDELTAKEKKIHEQGLVSVLRQIHDDLDKAVFDSYGWPHDLSDDQILERLVSLNAERAEEERRGIVRWLRPDFQKAAGKEQPAQATIGVEVEIAEGAVAKREPAIWPKELQGQVAAIRDLVAANGGAQRIWSVDEAARVFKGARKREVESVLDALAALGLVIAFQTDEGRRWRAAG